MEQVSENFKTAIKSDVRRIYGYVDVIYSLPTIDYTTYSIELSNTDYALIKSGDSFLCEELLNGKRRKENYASLEEDYFKLDGSFVLPSSNNDNENCGFISECVFSDLEGTPTICLKANSLSNSVNFKYMTIYFKDNNPRELKLQYTYNSTTYTEDVQIDDASVVQLSFDYELNTYDNPVTIAITDVEYTDRRIRIEAIDFGLTNSYRDSNLIDFTVTEEVDKLNVDMPINEVSVNIGDYEENFNYLNPTGFVEVLNEDVMITPYVGILTEDNGVEYVQMGIFYLTDWSSNSDKTVTLNGSDLFYKLSDNDYIRALDSEKNHITMPLEDYLALKAENWGVSIDYLGHSNSSTVVNDEYVTVKDKRSSLQELAVRYGAIVNCNRSGIIEFKKYDNETDYTIELVDQLEYPQVTAKTLIKNCIINEKYYTTKSTIQDMLTESIPVTFSGEEYFYVNFEEFRMTAQAFIFSVTGTVESIEDMNFNGNYHWVDRNFAIVKIVGEGSGVLEVNTYDYDLTTTENTTSLNTTGDDLTIDNDYLMALGTDGNDINLAAQEVLNYYKNIKDKYSYSLNWIGDPTINVGDYIKIATKFGDYKDVFVTKLTTKYNGGLSSTLEGVGE